MGIQTARSATSAPAFADRFETTAQSASATAVLPFVAQPAKAQPVREKAQDGSSASCDQSSASDAISPSPPFASNATV